MDRDQVQQQLMSAYQKWKACFQVEGLTLGDFSPPLLLAVTEDYCRASKKIIVYGQQTAGWSWTDLSEKNWPDYPNWPFSNQYSLSDFLSKGESIEALCWAYSEFSFAKYQPSSRNSPFWQAFREIQHWAGAGVMWSNLVRVDYKDGSIFNADPQSREALLSQQVSVMLDELKALNPNMCIFFTGPDYDPVLRTVFRELGFKQIDATPSLELARIAHADLPLNSYRTYHPNYLSQSKKWSYIDLIRSSSQ